MDPKYVAKLELSKRLKELGYPQKGEWWWHVHPESDSYFLDKKHLGSPDGMSMPLYAAPMAPEIKEKMPTYYPTTDATDDSEQIMLYWRDEYNLWCVGFLKGRKFIFSIMNSDTEADACAAAMIVFLEKKMISF